MNILVLYQFNIHDETIDALCKNLKKKGIRADSLNVITWRFTDYDKKRRKFLIILMKMCMKIPKLRNFAVLKFRTSLLNRLSTDYDVIDIHFFSPIYDELIRKQKKYGKAIKITVWGSDFYRTDEIRREQQRKLYHQVNIIQVETRQIANDFLGVYPEFADKIRLAHFGIRQFDIIDELSGKRAPGEYKKEMGLPADKIIVSCGFNGSTGHQHPVIFNTIDKLAPEIKAQLFLIIPLTYGADHVYIETIRKKADLLGIPYKLLSESLSLHEVCKLRIVCDIAVTIQKTDALSAAIQEQLYAGNILIAGDWLPYQILSENKIFFIQTTLESLGVVLTKTIENYGSIKRDCSVNKTRTGGLSSWNAAVLDWLAVYNELGGAA